MYCTISQIMQFEIVLLPYFRTTSQCFVCLFILVFGTAAEFNPDGKVMHYFKLTDRFLFFDNMFETIGLSKIVIYLL